MWPTTGTGYTPYHPYNPYNINSTAATVAQQIANDTNNNSNRNRRNNAMSIDAAYNERQAVAVADAAAASSNALRLTSEIVRLQSELKSIQDDKSRWMDHAGSLQLQLSELQQHEEEQHKQMIAASAQATAALHELQQRKQQHRQQQRRQQQRIKQLEEQNRKLLVENQDLRRKRYQEQSQNNSSSNKKRRRGVEDGTSGCDGSDDSDNDEDEDDSTSSEEEEDYEISNNMNPITTGKRQCNRKMRLKPNPKLNPGSGLIDGRSNAQLAFEQRCDLLREFKAEFGHVNVRKKKNDPNSLPKKYWSLEYYIEKQRKNYDPTNPVMVERRKILEQIGVQFDTYSPAERWNHNFLRLKEFHTKYGHCCISAVQKVQQQQRQRQQSRQEVGDNNSNDDNDQDDNDNDEVDYYSDMTSLQKWTQEQRLILKHYEKKMEQQQEAEAITKELMEEEKKEEESQNQNHGRGGNGGVATNNNMQIMDDGGGGDHNHNSEQHEGDGTATNNNKKKKISKVPKYFTREMRDQLLSLNCDYLNSVEDHERTKTPEYQRFFRAKITPNSCVWYQYVEETRQYAKTQKRNGRRGYIADTAEGKNSQDKKIASLARFTEGQRALYFLVKEDGGNEMKESNGVFERNFKLLESVGFVFDCRDIVERERKQKRIAIQEKINQEAAEKSSAAKLAAAQKKVSDARDILKGARKKKKEAKGEIKEAQRKVTHLMKAVKEAQKQVDDDPVGKLVFVKPRGGGKDGGDAKILKWHSATVVGQKLVFYDVEYVADGRKDHGVDSIFCCRPEEKERVLREIDKQKAAAALSGLRGKEDNKEGGGGGDKRKVATLSQRKEATPSQRKVATLSQRKEATIPTLCRIGEIVFVTSRGICKPGGQAKILSYKTKNSNNHVQLFYDVEYLNTGGRREYGIECTFVLPRLSKTI